VTRNVSTKISELDAPYKFGFMESTRG